jgi:DNA repair protein RadC
MKRLKNIIQEPAIEYKLTASIKAPMSEQITASGTANAYAREHCYKDDDIAIREKVYAIYLNRAKKVKGYSLMGIGGTSSCVCEVKMLLKIAIDTLSDAVIVVHNHPSGGMMPSVIDDNLTKSIKEGCDAIGIELCDHIILSGVDNNYYSYVDMGKL